MGKCLQMALNNAGAVQATTASVVLECQDGEIFYPNILT
jgi:hypothetical protein